MAKKWKCKKHYWTISPYTSFFEWVCAVCKKGSNRRDK